MQDVVRQRIRVGGRVQGVGFRWFTVSVARELGLSGFVRNERDGGVLCEAQGAPDLVLRLVERLRAGPPHALVTEVSTQAIAVVAGETEFDVRR